MFTDEQFKVISEGLQSLAEQAMKVRQAQWEALLYLGEQFAPLIEAIRNPLGHIFQSPARPHITTKHIGRRVRY